MADKPRWWKNGSVYSEVKNCIDRMFFLKPTSEIRNIVGACLGRALERYPVKIYWVDTNVTHEHRGREPFEDQEKNMSKFDQYYYSLLTRDINRLNDRVGGGTIWAGRVRSEECVDDESTEQQFFYGVTNMAKDGLLDRAAHNKGFGSYKAIASGNLYERFSYIDRSAWHRAGGERCKRPQSDFRKWVKVEYSKIPPWEHLTNSQYATRFRREVRALEKKYRQERQEQGRRPMGASRLAKLDPRGRPNNLKKRTRQPLCHASTPDGADDYQKEWRSFLEIRAQASELFLEGNLYVAFPKGSFPPPLIMLRQTKPAPGT